MSNFPHSDNESLFNVLNLISTEELKKDHVMQVAFLLRAIHLTDAALEWSKKHNSPVFCMDTIEEVSRNDTKLTFFITICAQAMMDKNHQYRRISVYDDVNLHTSCDLLMEYLILLADANSGRHIPVISYSPEGFSSKFHKFTYPEFPHPRYRSPQKNDILNKIMEQAKLPFFYEINPHEMHLGYLINYLNEINYLIKFKNIKIKSLSIYSRYKVINKNNGLSMISNITLNDDNENPYIDELNNWIDVASFINIDIIKSKYDVKDIGMEDFTSYANKVNKSQAASSVKTNENTGCKEKIDPIDIINVTNTDYSNRSFNNEDENKSIDNITTNKSENNTIELFNDSAIEKIKLLISSDTKDNVKVLQSSLNIINELSKFRSLATIKDNVFEQDIFKISGLDRFPNFKELTTYLLGQFALCALTDKVLRLPPVLLIGPPGIGKTQYISCLADALETTFRTMSMGSTVSGFSLAGLEIYYRGTRPGIVFDQLVLNKIANPIIFLDEIDKAGKESPNAPSSTGPLLQLLERKSAKQFEDNSVPGFKFDASHVVWFAAANDEYAIDAPILSRFKVFHIAEPTKAEMPIIIESIYEQLIQSEKWGSVFAKSLNNDVIDHLVVMPPRKIKLVLENAAANAAISKRNHILIEDVVIEKSKMKMGF